MRYLLTIGCLLVASGPAKQLFAEDDQPLRIAPNSIKLIGPRSQQKLFIRSQNRGFDFVPTRDSLELKTTDPNVATVDFRGIVVPRGNGKCELIVKRKDVPDQLAKASIEVTDYNLPAPYDFQKEVIPALSRGGCSQGACHGSPQGKNGFRLSLRGFEPALDAEHLKRREFGRRLNPIDPAQSLLLAKGTARIPHQGGRRFKTTDPAYHVLKEWIREGATTTDEIPQLSRLEVLPRRLRVDERSRRVAIVARAHFGDGTVRDVTDLAVFSTPAKEAIRVEETGEIEFEQTTQASVLVRYLDRIEIVELTYVERDEEFRFTSPVSKNDIDRLVFAKQKQLQLRPNKIASDEVFLRRVYLDLIGGIPGPSEARKFLQSPDPHKRSKLIETLLKRKEYAAFWALKWADVMRGNRETITHRGVHALHRYLVRNFAQDRSFDSVAREILVSKGNTIHVPEASFYRISRTPNETAESFSQLFLGVRIGCAKCHNHPYESITQRDYYGMAAFFSRVQLKGKRFGLDDETVFLSDKGEVTMPGSGKDLVPAAFGSKIAKDGPSDRRQFLASWLVAEDNPYFARSTVNRIWFHLMGQGLVDPVDDFRTTNPASNEQLLDHLAQTFSKNGFRFKPVIREILNSNAYQLSSRDPVQQSKRSANPERYFIEPIIRLLSAEQIIDAISQSSGVPEAFPGYPRGTKAIQLAEGDINHRLLKAFTRPVRDVACDCARETEPTLNQIIHLINNPSVLDKVDASNSRLSGWLKKKLSNTQIVENMYLATLSRFPTPGEKQLAEKHVNSAKDRTEGLRDLQHALWNSNEFLLRH